MELCSPGSEPPPPQSPSSVTSIPDSPRTTSPTPVPPEHNKVSTCKPGLVHSLPSSQLRAYYGQPEVPNVIGCPRHPNAVMDFSIWPFWSKLLRLHVVDGVSDADLPGALGSLGSPEVLETPARPGRNTKVVVLLSWDICPVPLFQPGGAKRNFSSLWLLAEGRESTI